MPRFLVVTRHAAFIDLLRRRGLVPPDAPVIAHATAEDVRGAHVFGQLPLELHALAASLTTICLPVPPELRGQELTLEWLLANAGPARTYRVEECEVPRWEEPAEAPAPATPQEPTPAPRPAGITITRDGDAVLVACPYYPPWRDAAQWLGGVYERPLWRFEAASEDEVRCELREVYGTTGDDSPDLVDVEYTVSDGESRRNELFALGLRLAYRGRWDGQVTLGEGVEVARGGFPRSGGNRNHAELEAWRDTVLLVRGVPGALARAAEDGGRIVIVGATAPEGGLQ